MNLKKREIVGYSILTGIILILLYLYMNPVKVYTELAEIFYGKNNIKLAQLYMEKAILTGEYDVNIREKYVNSIINSPFDIDSQLKLEKFLNIPINDSAYERALYFLNTYREIIKKNYPQNYISDTVYNQKVVRWTNMPISYGFVNKANVPSYFVDEIEKAFHTWQSALDNQLSFIRDDNSANILIQFDMTNNADENSTKYVVAYTVPELNVEQLSNMRIHFYLTNPDGTFYSENQIYNTALHEIAHSLGFMGHSNNPEHIMHTTKDYRGAGNDERSGLSVADINTVKLLYKIQPDITNSSQSDGIYTPYLILGGANQIRKLSMDSAVSYIENAPACASGYIDLADAYLSQKDYINAEKNLLKALKRVDTNELLSIIYYNLGVVYYYSESYEKAQKYLLASLNIQPSNDAEYILAQIYFKTGKTNDAIQLYKTLISKNPDNVDYIIGLTNIYVKERKYVSARTVLKKYFELNPSQRVNRRFKSYGMLLLFL